jgi:uncharacterized protein YqgC (DUF456 family)
MNPDSIWVVLSVVFIVIGFAGTLLPVLPGLPLVLVGMIIAAWTTDFTAVGMVTLAVLLLLTLLGLMIDVFAALIGANRFGASSKATYGTVIGSILGFFMGGLYGLIFGPLLGAAAGEQLHGGDWKKSARVGLGTWLGIAVGGVAKLIIALIMIAIFLGAWFAN